MMRAERAHRCYFRASPREPQRCGVEVQQGAALTFRRQTGKAAIVACALRASDYMRMTLREAPL